MRIRELRAKAKEDSIGYKMKLVLPMFAISVITFLLEFIPEKFLTGTAQDIVSIICAIIALIIAVGGAYAMIIRAIQVIRKEELSSFVSDTFGRGLKNGFACVWGIIKKTWYWILLLVVGYALITFGVLGAMSMEMVGGISSLDPDSLATSDPSTSNIILLLVGFVIVIFSAIKLTIASYRYFLVTYLRYDYPDKSINELLEQSDEMMAGNKAKAFVVPFTFIGWFFLSGLLSGVVAAVFEIIWPSQLILGVSVSTMPAWASILLEIITDFIVSFVAAYMVLTMAEFYMERNPLEIYNEDYVKPETNEKKYKKIIIWICLIFGIISIAIPLLGAAIFVKTSGITNSALESINSIAESLENY